MAVRDTLQLAASRDEATVRLRSALGRLNRSLRLTHADRDLSASQREVLAAVYRHGRPIRLSELAAAEGLNATMLSRIIAKLDAARLTVRRADDDDARVVLVDVTDQGRALHEQMRSERTDALRDALDRITPKQQRQIVEALPALEALVEAMRRRPS